MTEVAELNPPPPAILHNTGSVRRIQQAQLEGARWESWKVVDSWVHDSGVPGRVAPVDSWVLGSSTLSDRDAPAPSGPSLSIDRKA